MEAIVAVSKNLTIGKDGKLPWHVPEDLKRFRSMTSGHVLVMGRKTFESLPKVLPNRKHIVITHDPQHFPPHPDVVFTTLMDAMGVISLTAPQKVFVIGGSEILCHFLPMVQRIYLTLIDKNVEGDTKLPSLESFSLASKGEVVYCEQEKCNIQFLQYVPSTTKSYETEYIHLLNDLLRHGALRSDRTGTGTKSVFGRQLRFCLQHHIPLLTTKFTAWKSCIKELLWFLRGDTDATILKQQGVGIWDGNTTRSFLDNRGLSHLPEGDIGAGYGFQWRHFGADYDTCKSYYDGCGIDQIDQLIHNLRHDPFSRRHIVSAWNPMALDKMALPPCHIMFQFYVEEDEHHQRHLSCHMYQRSVDSFLGLPFNIFSYAVLTCIVAMKVDMQPKELIISTGDTHVYLDHLSQVEEQVQRTPCPLPTLLVHPSVKDKPWSQLTIDDFEVRGYLHHPVLKGKMSV